MNLGNIHLVIFFSYLLSCLSPPQKSSHYHTHQTAECFLVNITPYSLEFRDCILKHTCGTFSKWILFRSLISSVFSQDVDAVVPHEEDSVLVLKRAISKGDTGTVEQLLDDGKYSLHL